MSALAKMLMGGMADSLPPEMQQYMTPEGQALLKQQVTDYTKKLEYALVESVLNSRAILANQKIIMETLNVGEQYSDGKPTSSGDGSREPGAVAA